jgi:hypothetical protein
VIWAVEACLKGLINCFRFIHFVLICANHDNLRRLRVFGTVSSSNTHVLLLLAY